MAFLESHRSFRICALTVHLTSSEHVAAAFAGTLDVGGRRLSPAIRHHDELDLEGFGPLAVGPGPHASTRSGAFHLSMYFAGGSRRRPNLESVTITSLADIAKRSPGPFLVQEQQPDGRVEPVAAFPSAAEAQAEATRRADAHSGCRYVVEHRPSKH